MELKCAAPCRSDQDNSRSNRTFMELKLLSDSVVTYLFMF